MKFVDKENAKYQSIKLDYKVAPKNVVIAERQKEMAKIVEIDEIKPYQATFEQLEDIKALLNKKLSRSEIARQMRMTKSMLLWALYEIQNETNMGKDERVGHTVFVDRLTYETYKLIKQSDFTIMQMSRELKADPATIRDIILFLEQNEAIKIKRNHNIVNYIPLNKIIKMKRGQY